MIRNLNASGIGPAIEYKGTTVMNRTGATLAVGELVMVDKLAGDAGFGGNASAAAYVAVTDTGAEGFPLNNILTPTTAGLGALGAPGTLPSWLCVVDDILTTGKDDTAVHVCFRGFTVIKMAGTVGAGEYGKPLFGANAVRTATQTVTNGLKCLGWLLQDTTTADTNARCIFDGMGGFGVEAAS